MAESRALRLHCYAKVNLTLEVLGRRPDGYHELASVVRTISLADDLDVSPAETFSIAVDGMDLPDEENLVVRAAALLGGGRPAGVTMRLRKRIPAAAGLGGGSSDAAAALAALDHLWGTRIGIRALRELAARLGSDVPFFLRGGTAVLRGRGDRLEPLSRIAPQWLVLVVRPHALENKTASLYRALSPDDYSDGAATEALAARLLGREVARDEDLVNAFARGARSIFPGLSALWDTLQRSTGRQFHVSGAGPALFALVPDRRVGQALVQQIGGASGTACIVRTVERGHSRHTVR